MASVSDKNEPNAMANEGLSQDGAAEGRAEKTPAVRGSESQATARISAEPSFFTIYKRGQGYWTRMGTALMSALLVFLTARFLYENLGTWTLLQGPGRRWLWVIVGVFFVAMTVLAYWLQNRATNVDFLIATDGEMKKVNWTSRKELIGSTKVVIVFMLAIAMMLFVVDILFGYLFYFIKVLKFAPFQGA